MNRPPVRRGLLRYGPLAAGATAAVLVGIAGPSAAVVTFVVAVP